jgi:hypothetical protein
MHAEAKEPDAAFVESRSFFSLPPPPGFGCSPNVWQTNWIVRDGTAYDTKHDRLFVTGKNWPKLFEIRVRGPIALNRLDFT